ncbi:tetraprenyl-beta-curcumene synthase family protein [Natranaerofaba carboxydovora]|uniref:tetraprenyl-beta-curcumene synthase family protein n=1 Tax=Natranaerofaba carboxydovora TaxID=2742683 RepID=UPI001F12B4EA|nr:tetraprenyl-beta-curcumene synthase family protein [Natranaerofaba carboxydovora]UMZ73182.1 Tetraprenyl-beta-curcumene synthase [Natranaerofaba carboxydovora]
MITKSKTTGIIYDFVSKIFPLVEQELNHWRDIIRAAPDKELAKQGLFSIEDKKFHALGGSVFALYNEDYKKTITSLITSYQTISDYLDNLCDRTGIYSKKAFSKLHDSMFDALSLDEVEGGYYKYFPYKDDGDYLTYLVQNCRDKINKFSRYSFVEEDIKYFIGLYRDLQVLKHIEPAKRESELINWFQKYKIIYPDIRWWEFSCASGSTLLVFALTVLSTRDDFGQEEKEKIINAYFPWICGFHIMLDYYIDQKEDEIEGDLNLVSFYHDEKEQEDRLLFFCEKSLEEAAKLPESEFHLAVVKGMISLYLSDPKVKLQGLQNTAKRILKAGGNDTRLMYYLCMVLRTAKKI